MEVTFRFAVRTDLGTVRTNNEDSAIASAQLLVLADGMGGHAAGEVASTVATRVFASIAADVDGADGEHPDVDAVAAAITHAGRSTRMALHRMSEADPVLESMGTTLLAVVSHGQQVTVGHIGDSRVYALRGSSLFQVTTDHTHVQRLIDTGQLTPEKARTHPYRAMLLRSLDDQPGGPDLDVISLQIEPGDRLLLCSDGLSDYLPPEDIGRLLATPDRADAADALIETALQVGTRDNVTVVVADVVAEPADDEPMQLAGAVVDPLELSTPATSALLSTLPTLADFVVQPTTAPEPDETTGDEPDDSVQTAETTETEPEPITGAAPDRPEPAAEEPAEPAPAAHADGSQTPQRPQTSSARPEAWLPATLASGLVIVLGILIWMLLD